MATETATLTHCPTCGAKLHRQDLSLCAYCGSPLALGGRAAPAKDETAERLARLREHPGFAQAMELVPPDLEAEEDAVKLERRSWLMVGVAVVVIVVALLARASLALASLPVWLAAVALLGAGVLQAAAASTRVKAARSPLLRRPALVVDRRSETRMVRGAGATIYFFLLHFDDGSEGEFEWPGRGTLYDPMPNGTTGIAYTRGARLIEFRKL